MALNREALTKKVEVAVAELPAPEFGGTVLVKGMTALERTDFERSLQVKGKASPVKMKVLRERLVVACVVDENRQPVFTEADIPLISQMPATFVERIVNKAMELCGMSSKDAKDLEGNSEETSDPS